MVHYHVFSVCGLIVIRRNVLALPDIKTETESALFGFQERFSDRSHVAWFRSLFWAKETLPRLGDFATPITRNFPAL